MQNRKSHYKLMYCAVKMEHNFGIYLSVNFECGSRLPCCLLSICVPYCWGVRSRAARHYADIHEGPVSSPQEEIQIFL